MSLVLTAHQPAYLPWLGLLSKIASADLFCIFDVCPMEDSGFENRQKIKTQSGPLWLTVPVRRSRGVPLKDVEIANDQPWQRKHWRSIEMAYQRAPYFETYAPSLKNLLCQRWHRLAWLNRTLLLYFMARFGIKTPVVQASDYDFQGTKSDLVLDMCLKLGATKYIFGAMGRDYADVAAFERAGIEVEFQDFAHPTYPQLHGAFVPNMGCLDLLFNVGGIGVGEWNSVVYERREA